MPVTNDAPRALSLSVDTGRNNVAGFSPVKWQGRRNTPEAELSDTCVLLSPSLSEPQPGNLINLIMLIPGAARRRRTGGAVRWRAPSPHMLLFLGGGTP